jgi:hypothetical protein
MGRKTRTKLTPAKYFRWTPEAVDFLRRSAGVLPDRQIAFALHCSYWAVVNKKKEMKFVASDRSDLSTAQRYARLYHIPHSIVDFIGAEKLIAMPEEECRHTLWNASRRLVRPRGGRETTEQVERMMELARKVA